MPQEKNTAHAPENYAVVDTTYSMCSDVAHYAITPFVLPCRDGLAPQVGMLLLACGLPPAQCVAALNDSTP